MGGARLQFIGIGPALNQLQCGKCMQLFACETTVRVAVSVRINTAVGYRNYVYGTELTRASIATEYVTIAIVGKGHLLKCKFPQGH